MIELKSFRQISQEEAAAKRIRRLLSTNIGNYSVYQTFGNGLYKWEEPFGSLVPKLLSLPKTQTVLNRIKETARKTLENDDYIILNSISIKQSDGQEVILSINYKIPEDAVNENTIEVAV